MLQNHPEDQAVSLLTITDWHSWQMRSRATWGGDNMGQASYLSFTQVTTTGIGDMWAARHQDGRECPERYCFSPQYLEKAGEKRPAPKPIFAAKADSKI